MLSSPASGKGLIIGYDCGSMRRMFVALYPQHSRCLAAMEKSYISESKWAKTHEFGATRSAGRTTGFEELPTIEGGHRAFENKDANIPRTEFHRRFRTDLVGRGSDSRALRALAGAFAVVAAS